MNFDRRLFGLTEGVRLRLLGSALAGMLAVSAGVARLALSGILIARVFQGEPVSALVQPLLLIAVLVVIRTGFQYVRDVLTFHTASAVKIKLRRKLYQHVLLLGPGHFNQRRTGDVLLTMVDGVEGLETVFGQYLPQLLVAIVTPLLIFIYMVTLDLQIALIFLGFALFTLFVPAILRSWNASSSAARRTSYGVLGAEFLDSVQGLGTLKSFGQSGARGAMLAEKARNLYRTTMWVLGANIATSGVSMLGVSAGATTALIYGATRVHDGQMPLSTLMIVLLLGVEVFRPLRELVQLYHQGIMALAASQGIFALLDTPVEVNDAKPPVTTSTPGANGHIHTNGTGAHPSVRLENVSFSYNGGQRPALRGLSLTLNEGETLGIVGPSGAGKSTIVWLLLRFFDPQNGRIMLGERDLREIPLDELREQIAVVSQDTYLFHGTIAENLRFGKPSATQAELEAAAQAANVHEFIAALPDGYETLVGERGARLSGGQRQRIAIARALLKDAPLLILDEALSSVDAENEAVIQEALNRLMEGRTTLVIAHRLSSVVGADRIIALEDGRVVETGSHEELLAANGLYARLMAHQRSDDGAEPEMPTAAVSSAVSPKMTFVQVTSVSNGAKPADSAEHSPDHEGNGHSHGSEEHDHGANAHSHEANGHDHAANGHDHSAHSHGTNGHQHNGHDPQAAVSPTPPQPEVAKRYSTLMVWQRLLGLVRPWWGEMSFTFFIGLLHHASVIGLGVLSAILVGRVATNQEIGPWIWALAILVPISAVLTWAESWKAHDLAYRLLAEMRIDMYNKLEPLAPAYLVKRRTGDLVSIVGSDIETVELFFAHTITPAFIAVMIPSFVLITLGVIAWPLALVLSPFLLVVAISPFFAQRKSELLGEQVRDQRGDVNAHMVDSIQGLREIVAFDQGPRRTEEIEQHGWRLAGFQHKLLAYRSMQSGLIEAMTGLGGLAVLTTGAYFVSQGAVPRTELPLVTLLALAAFAPVAELARTAKELVETLAASRRVFAVHDEPVPVLDGPGVAGELEQNAHGAPSVAFESVTFSYGHGETQALSAITMGVKPGQTVALVGRSGAGKTTSAHLIMRFWDPTQGRVLLGGHDLREFGLEDLRRRIALVSQETYLFNTTLRENLRLGNPEATDAEVEEAARLANAHEFIMAMPEGYATMVGERGVQLSGGQRQRIAIARALLKGSPLLILDEATSHLDAVNEFQVREALDRLMEGRTTVVIAHRLSTVRSADLIVVMDAGNVVEQGSHQELLARDGLYAQLVSTQMVSGAAAIDAEEEPELAPIPLSTGGGEHGHHH